MCIRHSVFVYIVCVKFLLFTKQEVSQNGKVFLLLLNRKLYIWLQKVELV